MELQKIYDKLNIVVFDIEILARADDVMARYFAAYEGFGMGADISDMTHFGYLQLGEGRTAQCIHKWTTTETPESDEQVVREAFEILRNADVIVTFYGTKFDRRFINARFAKYGLYLDPRIRHIDMHRVVKKHFKLTSNSLNNVLKFFGMETKLALGSMQSKWYSMYKGDKEVIQEISDYCAQDVQVLANLFERLMPLVPLQLPSNLVMADPADELKNPPCPKCGIEALQKHGVFKTTVAQLQRYRCTNCGSTCSTNMHNKEKVHG
jgi:DNA polymerase elongation subunit (family B)